MLREGVHAHEKERAREKQGLKERENTREPVCSELI